MVVDIVYEFKANRPRKEVVSWIAFVAHELEIYHNINPQVVW